MQALFLIGAAGEDGSLTNAFFRDMAGEVTCFVFLLLFEGVFRLASGEAGALFFLDFFFVDVFGASGDVDAWSSGSLDTSSTST
jgi:hypothetical protein